MKILVISMALFFGAMVFAQAPVLVPASAAAPAEFHQSPEPDIFTPPLWLKAVLLQVYSLPVAGPIAVEIFKWLGVLASVLTALATAFFGVVQVLSRVLKLAKLVELANKLDALYVKVWPYLKFVSVYNAEKSEFK